MLTWKHPHTCLALPNMAGSLVLLADDRLTMKVCTVRRQREPLLVEAAGDTCKHLLFG